VLLDKQINANAVVIQLAKLSGLSPIITTSSLKHADFLKSLGATHVLDRNLFATAASLRGEIEKITTAPIEYVYDAVSAAETQQAGHDLLAPGGQLLVILPTKVTQADDKTITSIRAFWTESQNTKLLEHMYSKLTLLLEEGVIIVCSALLPGCCVR